MSISATSLPARQPLLLSAGSEQFRLGRKGAAIVALFGLSLLLPNLDGATRSLTYHEVIFAQPAREMLATGNWILPHFAGVPTTHKPPGAHTAIAIVMWLTGSEAEQLVRIPSVLAGVITSLIVSALAARWFGCRVGIVAGLMHVTSYYVLQLARLAECDMLMIAAVTGAMATFAWSHLDSPRGRLNARWSPWLFYACATLAYFFKGLIGPAFIFSGCATYVLLSRDVRGLKFLLDPLGLALFVFSTLGWFLAAYRQYPTLLHDQAMHHFGRFQGEMGGGKNAFFYVYSIPLILLPWTVFILGGLVQGVRSGRLREPFWRFAACWVAPGLVLLSFSTFKSKHYAAPLMPPLTIIAALSLLAFLRFQPWRLMLVQLALVVAVCTAGFAWLQGAARLPAVEKHLMSAIFVLLAAGMAVIVYFQRRGKLTAVLATIFAVTWLSVGGIFGWIMPRHDSYRDQTELARRINQTVPEGRELYLLQLPANGENQITYYLHRPLRRLDDPANFAGALPDGEPECYVLAPVLAAPELEKHGSIEALDTHAPRRKQPENERLVLYRLHRTTAASRQELTR